MTVDLLLGRLNLCRLAVRRRSLGPCQAAPARYRPRIAGNGRAARRGTGLPFGAARNLVFPGAGILSAVRLPAVRSARLPAPSPTVFVLEAAQSCRKIESRQIVPGLGQRRVAPGGPGYSAGERAGDMGIAGRPARNRRGPRDLSRA